MMRFEFQIAPTLAGDFSLIPIDTMIPRARASSRIAFTSGPSTGTD